MSFQVYELWKDSAVLGITVDNDGTIYFTTGVRGLWKITPNAEPNQLIQLPDCVMSGIVWCEKSNNLYICDTNGDFSEQNTILRYSIDTKSEAMLLRELGIKTNFITPRGITVDKLGNILICDKQSVKKINLEDCTIQTVAGVGASPSSGIPFCSFSGIVVDNGTMYVSDFNRCIRKIENGIVSVLVGTPVTKQAQVKTFESSLESPSGLCFDVDGNLLVADVAGLRKVNLQTITVTTIYKTKALAVHCSALSGLLLGTYYNGLLHVVERWKVLKLLWVANRKEDTTTCFFALLPKDIVNEIIEFVYPFVRSRNKKRKQNTQAFELMVRKKIQTT